MLLITILLLFALGTHACPSVCTCSSNTVDCQQQSLTSLPTGIPATTENLYLQGNSFPTLSADMFAAYPSLQVLRLDSCGITTLDAGAFNGLTALTELSMSENSIQSFPDNIFDDIAPTIATLKLAQNSISSISAANLFSGMTSLTSLDLSTNQLASIPANVFMDLSAVTTFTLESNALTIIGATSLSGLTSVTTLNLHSNQITSIEAGAFGGLTAVQVINLNNNQLATLVDGVFSSLNSLEELNLQSNQLSTLASSMFSNLPLLETVNLRNNQLTSGYDAFGSVSSLRSLDLSGNSFTSISAVISNSQLRTLDLSENDIVSVTGFTFASLSAIQTINLQKNQITTIDGGVFGGLATLETLDLSFNNLASVPSSSFDGLLGNTNVQNLILSDNQISSVEANAFIDCPNVRVIDLRRNSLSTLTSNSFANLAQVRTIHLSFNSLSEIPSQAFTTLTRLETISFEENLLEQVRSGAFENLDVMTSLNLSNNIIHTMEGGAFVNTPLLASLYLNENRLTVVPKSALVSLTGLQTLDMSSNLLTALSEAKSFGDLNNLENLYLQSNQITSIVEDSLGGLPALIDVDLSSNQLQSITVALSLSNDVPSLTTFNLASNRLASLSLAVFTGFSALETLDLSQNSLASLQEGILEVARSTITSLVLTGNVWQCDCDLKWLQVNYTSLISNGVCATPAEEQSNTLGPGGTWVPGDCVATTIAMTTTPAEVIPLTITTSPYTVEVDSGQEVSLVCNAVGTLQPTVAWTSPIGDVILTGQQFTFDQTAGTLNISGVTPNMAGDYYCNADNAAGDRASLKVIMVVRYPPIIVQFSEVAVMSDATVTLTCEVSAYPHATVYWTTPNGLTINETSTGSLIVTSSGTLHMADRSWSDTGNYICHASNELGQTNRTGFLYIYNSTSSYPLATRTVIAGEQVLLTSGGLVLPADTVFAWSLPTGHFILHSVALDSSQQSLKYISPSYQLSTQGDGSTQSLEMDSKFSVDISTGALTINSFSTSAISVTDAVTSQAGAYACRSVRGVFNYDVIDETMTTTTTPVTTTTTIALVTTSGSEALSEVSIYYIVLGVLLFVALAGFIFLLARMRREKDSDQNEEQLIPSEI